MITRWVVRKLDDRLAFSGIGRTALNKVFPDHWSFMMGEIALYAFVYLVASGVFLTLFFDPSTADTVYTGSYAALHGSTVSAAYASAVELSQDVPLGLVMRQSHHWAALIFIGAIVVHLCRIFFTGAYRRPREINWVVGVTLLLLAMANGFAGYSLPDDLLSGTGLRVANAVVLSVPVIGAWLDMALFGGEFPGDDIVPRLYGIHILVVPAAIALLVGLHMAILVRQKHSQFPGPGRTGTNVVGSRLWPGYAVRSVGLMFSVFALAALLGGLVQINPVWLWGPFEPGSATAPAQPDWYVGWMDGALRLYPPWEPSIFGYVLPNVFVPGALLSLATFVALYAWPFVDRRVTHDRLEHQVLDRPRDRPGRMALGVGALAFYGLLLVSFSLDLLSRVVGISVITLVAVFRVLVPVGAVVAGAVAGFLARALRMSEADGVLGLSLADLRAAMRPRHRPAAAPRQRRQRRRRGRSPAPTSPHVEAGPTP